MIARPGQRQRRPALTLLELMVTLSIAALLLAIVWPSLRKPLEKSRGREAAQQLARALSNARFEAIQRSRLAVVRFIPGTGYFRSETVAPARGRSAAEALDSGSPGAQPASGGSDIHAPLQWASDGASHEAGAGGWDKLPEGVRFWTPQLQDALMQSPLAVSPGGQGDSGELKSPLGSPLGSTTTMPGADLREISPNAEEDLPTIRFFPSGRSDSASIRLLTDQGRIEIVRLRGITGQCEILAGAAISKPTEDDASQRSTAGNALPEASP